MKKVFNKDFLILIFLTLIFFSVHMVVPYIGIDDFYAHSLSVGNPILRGITRGINWNMRIGEIILFTIGWLPKLVYNIIISLFFAYFLVLIKKYSKTDYKNKVSQYILYCFLIMCILMPSLVDVFFKMAESSNHLIGTCLILTALFPIIKFDKGIDIISSSKLKYSILVILSFLAGMASENNSIFILIFYLYVIIKNFIKSKKIVRWQIFSFIAALTGYILLIFSGSTIHRIEFFADMQGTFTTSLSTIFLNFYWYNKKIIFTFIILFLIYIIVGIIRYKRKFRIDEKVKYNLFLLLMSVSTILMFVFSPYYQNRGTLLLLFILIINIVDLINIILCDLNKILVIIISGILLVVNLISIYDIGSYFYDYLKFDKKRNIDIENQVKEKNIVITFPIYKKNFKTFNEHINQEYDTCSKEVLSRKYSISYDFYLICK